MKRFLFGLASMAVCTTLSLSLTAGPAMAGLFKKDDVIEKLDNAKTVTVIVPNTPDITDSHYTKLSFKTKKLGTERSSIININGSNITKREFIQEKKKIKGGVEIERRVDDGNAGSGKVYYVRCDIKDTPDGTAITFQPYKSRSYQQGLISFDVPEFSETDLSRYIIHHAISYKMEVDAANNSDVVFGNLVRLAPTAGENYNIPSGRIPKGNFAIPYGDGKLTFAVELYPAKTGTKAVVQGTVPGQYTSEGTVDFNVILKGIKDKIAAIVNG